MPRFMVAGNKQKTLGKPQKSFSLFWIVIALIIVGLLYNFMLSENYKRTNLTTADLKICGADFNGGHYTLRGCLKYLLAEDKKELPFFDEVSIDFLFTSSRTEEGQGG